MLTASGESCGSHNSPYTVRLFGVQQCSDTYALISFIYIAAKPIWIEMVLTLLKLIYVYNIWQFLIGKGIQIALLVQYLWQFC